VKDAVRRRVAELFPGAKVHAIEPLARRSRSARGLGSQSAAASRSPSTAMSCARSSGLTATAPPTARVETQLADELATSDDLFVLVAQREAGPELPP
jgi:hypothetical protein